MTTHLRILLCTSAFSAASVSSGAERPAGWPSEYNVRWTERGEWAQHGALGSVPLGSGRTGANVWADDSGVQILLSATEAYDEHSQLMKLGQVSLELDPNPFAPLPEPPPPPAPLPPTPPTGCRGEVGCYTQQAQTIGCANKACTAPQDTGQWRRGPVCSSIAACPGESAKACGDWPACTMFSIDPSWPSKAQPRAQLLSCGMPLAQSDRRWTSYYLNASTNCSAPAPSPLPRYPAFEQVLDIEQGLLSISSGGITVQLFADWNTDVIRVRVQASAHGGNFTAKVTTRNWRNVTQHLGDCSKLEANGNKVNPACGAVSDGGACFGQHGLSANVSIRADTVVHSTRPELLWYRRNPEYTLVDASMKQQLLNGTPHKNPLKNNTFGVLVSSASTSGTMDTSTDGHFLTTSRDTGPVATFELAIVAHVNQTASAAEWQQQIHAKRKAALHESDDQIAPMTFDAALTVHSVQWAEHWSRSWLHATTAPRYSELWNHTAAAALGRYVNLAQMRGDTPSHFTGGIFTFDSHDSFDSLSYDQRAWGGAYWWQNTRFAYDPLLADADHEQLLPLFELYTGMLPVVEAQVRSYYKHEGAKFYETAHVWGAAMMANWGCEDMSPNTKPDDRWGTCTSNNCTGSCPHGCRDVFRGDLYETGCELVRNGVSFVGQLSTCDADNTYIRHHFSSAIEVPLMMLRHFLHTYNVSVARRHLVPVATSTMRFFTHHWSNASFFMEDAQALETFSHCDQPFPQLAGLIQLLRGLLDIPRVRGLFAAEQVSLFDNLRSKVPTPANIGVKTAETSAIRVS